MSRTIARVRNVPTSAMRDEELARVFGEHYSIAGREGGWLYDAAGRALCHGWQSLATSLREQGVIVPGAGVEWRRVDLVGIDRVLDRVIARRQGEQSRSARRANARRANRRPGTLARFA